MTPDQLQQYRDLLAKGKFAPKAELANQYAYQRGVNAGVTFAEDCLAKVLKDEAQPSG